MLISTESLIEIARLADAQRHVSQIIVGEKGMILMMWGPVAEGEADRPRVTHLFDWELISLCVNPVDMVEREMKSGAAAIDALLTEATDAR